MRRHVPSSVFDFTKFFGSGVILTTGFIHLLEPATEELGGIRSEGGCLNDAWGEYPYAFAFCLISLFLAFVTQMVAFRLGTAHLAKLGNAAPPHVHVMGHPGHVQAQDRAASNLRGDAGTETAQSRESAASSLEKGEKGGEVGFGARGEEEAVDQFTDASEQNPIIAQVRARL